MNRGSSFAIVARTKKGLVFFWIALFVLSMGMQYVSAMTPRAALAAPGDPVIVQDPTPNGCNGVLPTPGSENTTKRLTGGSLIPGGTAEYKILFPVNAADVGGNFEITDCIFINGTAALKYFVHFVPNNQAFILSLTLNIPAGTPIGSEFCNYAKTTASPSASQASNRKAGPACFIVGGNISVLKTNRAGDPLAGAHFHIVCKLPTTDAFLPATIINGISHNSTSGGQITEDVVTDSTGRIAIQAPEGTSCVITETQAPPGYDIAADPSVTLVATSAGVDHTFVDPPEFVPAPELSITKVATEANYNSTNDTIHYTIVAKNVGNVVLHNVTITDPKAVLGTCTPTIPVTDLAINATITCSASHKITQPDIEDGHYLNTACVNDGTGGATEKCASADVPSVKIPALSITKVAGQANYDSVGDVITYTVVAKNTGNTTLAAVTITDANATLGTCTPANGSSLAPDATISCSASHTIIQADIEAGHYLNTACVDDGAGGAASICANADVPAIQTKTLSITKDDNTASYNHVGQVITYTIVATNSGNVPQVITVSDTPALDAFSCTPANGTSVAQGASMSCTGTHTVVQADLNAGNLHDVACADAPGATQTCAPDDVPAIQSPALSITKVADPTTYNAVGQTITYTIVAKNTGNVTIASATITDANATLGTCTPANGSSLDPLATITCSATHAITQGDIDAGHYLNTACVDDGQGGATEICADANVTAVSNKLLTILKTATEASYDSVGDILHYTVVATNGGNTTLAGVTITDENATLGTCEPANGSSLAPGASITCSATHTVNQADIDNGHYLNTACVSATDATATCDDADVPSTKNPNLDIVKTVTETSYGTVGDILHYTVIATNAGNTTLAAVTITDANATLGTCTPANGSALAPGASITCSATHTVNKADIDAGHYLNTACANASGAETACNSANVVVATLAISKTNNAPIEELELPDGTTASLPTAKEGATVTFTLTYSVGTSHLTNGIITDVLPAGLTYVEGSATSSTEFTFVPPFNTTTRTLTWTAANVTVGGTVTYKAKVNKGAAALDQPLTNIATIDSAQTSPSSDTSDVFVPVPPLAETHVPTAPPTDTVAQTEGQSGSSLPLILAILGVILLAVAFVTPVPAPVRRRNRR